MMLRGTIMPLLCLLFFLWLPIAMLPAAEPAAAPAPGQVFFVHETSSVLPGGKVSPTAVGRMVDALILSVTNQPDLRRAWLSLVSPEDVVGIKVSTGGRAVSGTRLEVVLAVIQGLNTAGIPADRIVVWDRNQEDLLAAGYSTKDPRYRLEWIDPRTGYDTDAILTAPVLGRLIWGDRSFGDRTESRLVDILSTGDQLSSKSHFAKILSRTVTKVINVASLQDSFMTGINGAMASMTLHNIDNWRRFTKPPHHGDPYIAEIFFDSMIREKVVLNLLDGLFMQYAGGPFPHPNFTIEHHMLLASLDPVALDASGRKFIDDQRLLNRLPPVRDYSGYLESAEYYGLGTANEQKIQLIRVHPGG